LNLTFADNCITDTNGTQVCSNARLKTWNFTASSLNNAGLLYFVPAQGLFLKNSTLNKYIGGGYHWFGNDQNSFNGFSGAGVAAVYVPPHDSCSGVHRHGVMCGGGMVPGQVSLKLNGNPNIPSDIEPNMHADAYNSFTGAIVINFKDLWIPTSKHVTISVSSNLSELLSCYTALSSQSGNVFKNGSNIITSATSGQPH
jgi:hypothetical protein